MNRPICLLFLVMLSVVPAVAQQRLNITIDKQPITSLFEMIEQQTGSKIYCIPGEVDTLKVTVNAVNREPLLILQDALKETPYTVTKYRDAFFILKDKEIINSLPDNYYITDTNSDNIIETNKKSLIEEEEQIAVSEQKVYEIGNSRFPKTGMVSLSGNITHIKTGEPLAGVTLFIENPLIGVTTDAFGYYAVQLPAGRHELNIRGLEVKETKRQLMLYSDGKLNVELEDKVYALSDVVVMGNKENNIRSNSVGIEYLKMKDIKNIPTAFGEADILRIVMLLPGVKSSGEVSSGFNVRGGATDQNLILYNEGIIYNPTHLFGLFSAFNPDVVSEMELYKSSIPVKYGGRISSVLDITNREGNKKEFQGSASIGLITSRLTVEGPLFKGKATYILGGRTTYSDWILKNIPPKIGFSNGSAGFYDLNGTFVSTINDRNKLFLNGYYSSDRFAFNEFEQYGYHNIDATAKWRHIFNQKLINVLTVGYDHYDYIMSNTEYPTTAYTLAYKINQGFLKSDISWFPTNSHSVNMGISSIFYNYSPGEHLPYGTDSLVASDKMQPEKALESALFIGDDWEITRKFSISAGVRYSIFNAIGHRDYNEYMPEYLPSLTTLLEIKSVNGFFKTYHGPEFRFSTRYALTDNLSVKAGFNSMRQYIHKISNTTIMSPTDTWKLSDVHIRPQTGMQIAGGIYKNFSKTETSVEIYYKTMNNYLDYRPGAILVMNHHIETELVNTIGKSYGVEIMLKKTAGKLNGWVSYTFARTMLRQVDKKITLPANDGEWYPSDFDKPHEVKFVGNYKFTHRYSVSLNVDYSTGRPITIPVAKYKYAGGQFVYYLHKNQYRIPDYFRIDLSFNVEPSHRLTLLTHSSFSFGVYNMTGRKNAHSVYYVAENGWLRGYKMSILGTVIPFISYNIKF